MSMSRDGLLPKVFSKIHPKYGTPSFSTILTGFLVAVPALFLNLDVVLALTSIGTLFAFVLVCGGILVLQQQKDRPESKFKVPYVNAQFIFPVALAGTLALIFYNYPTYFSDIFAWETFPMIIFWIVVIVLCVYTIKNKFSLIPILGLVSCFYLMAQESHTNWMRFIIWLAIGLVVYFLYGYSHSKLSKSES